MSRYFTLYSSHRLTVCTITSPTFSPANVGTQARKRFEKGQRKSPPVVQSNLISSTSSIKAMPNSTQPTSSPLFISRQANLTPIKVSLPAPSNTRLNLLDPSQASARHMISDLARRWPLPARLTWFLILKFRSPSLTGVNRFVSQKNLIQRPQHRDASRSFRLCALTSMDVSIYM